ncbi:hypothetical protein [Fusobacterium sp.]|uniref:hypothetical protein n=1 Tax=Fusobacterium sp. TaxID=68766 RepID=UPI0025B97FD8|nr:hypothetical protein [Fusobacterium sp.]
MKFITEEYLRKEFQNNRFDIFEIKANERLTPGGRQYLLDKKIQIMTEVEKQLSKTIDTPPIEEKKVSKKILYKLKFMEVFYSTLVIEIIEKNIKLAQRVLDICKEISELRKKYEFGNLSEKVEKNLEYKRIDSEIPEIYIHSKIGVELYKLKALLYDIFILKEMIFDEENTNKALISEIETIEVHVEEIIQELLGG